MITGEEEGVALGPMDSGTSNGRSNSVFQGNASIRDVATRLREPLHRSSSEVRQRKTLTIGVDDLGSIMKLNTVQYLNIHKKTRPSSDSDNDKILGSPPVSDMQSNYHIIYLPFDSLNIFIQ